MKRLYIILVATLVVLFPLGASAYVGLCCGKCGGNMPLNIPGGGVPETHELRLKIQPMMMTMKGLSDRGDSISPDALISGEPAAYMAVPVSMDMQMLNLAAGYSFTDDIFGGVMLMLNKKQMDMRFGKMMRMSTGTEGFTMESSGFGDIMLMGKYRLYTDDPLIPKSQASLFFALSVPTGSIDERNGSHPDPALRNDLLPYGMQIGSGTFDPTVGLLYQGSASPWWWGANFLYTARLYDNTNDYHLGDEVKLDLYGMYQLRVDTVLELQINASHMGSIRGGINDATGRSMMTSSGFSTPLWDMENYGGRKLGATVGVQWQPVPLQIINLQFGVPLLEQLNGPQLEDDYRVMLSWYVEIPTAKSRRSKRKGRAEKSKIGF